MLWKRTLTVLTLCWLCAAMASAQSAPVTFTVHDNKKVDATNVSTKTIVFMATNLGADDFYFLPGGRPPGATWLAGWLEWTPADPGEAPPPKITKVELRLIQFSDGTTWGDSSLFQTEFVSIIKGRVVTREFYQGAISAYDLHGDREFVSFLKQAKNTPFDPDPDAPFPDANSLANKYLSIQQTSGPAAAISEIRSHLYAAAGRSF
ncbi:MAG TPA: hypothetical protein VEI01_20380 [Terriglobales bacterium]|nr:hypothetical protein [Terriglobales bacterium]